MQAGHGSKKLSFRLAFAHPCNQPRAAHPSPTGLGEEFAVWGLRGESVLPQRALLASLNPFLLLPLHSPTLL